MVALAVARVPIRVLADGQQFATTTKKQVRSERHTKKRQTWQCAMNSGPRETTICRILFSRQATRLFAKPKFLLWAVRTRRKKFIGIIAAKSRGDQEKQRARLEGMKDKKMTAANREWVSQRLAIIKQLLKSDAAEL
jgi:hypothetical protein